MKYYSLMLCAYFMRELVKETQSQTSGKNNCLAEYYLVEGRFIEQKLWLCLKTIGSSPITDNNVNILLEPEMEEDFDQDSLIYKYPLTNVTMVFGYPLENPSAGSAEGYIGTDNQFYGRLHLRNSTILHADPYERMKWFPNIQSFDIDDLDFAQRTRRDQIQQENLRLPHGIQRSSDFRKSINPRGRICELLLLADKEFYDKEANSSLTHVVRRMVHAISQVDLIFRNADFNNDGIPDNIGFSVKYILVLTSNETDKRVFGDLSGRYNIDGRVYLMRFSRLRRLSEVCIGVAFSGHAFSNKTLGLSFTTLGTGSLGGAAGGMCDRRAYGRSFNTLAIAHATETSIHRVPEQIATITLAHEMGHSFGAYHDESFTSKECQGYLMSASSSSGKDPKHFQFSSCSKRFISKTLGSMSYCLADENKPYCGNGIVEENEACDCGLPSSCSEKDPCCTPRAGEAVANGERKLDRECTCPVMDAECRCGLVGRCLPDRTCHAADCTLLGLPECQCRHMEPGGAISEAKMCGVCCQFNQSNYAECIGVEFAAKRILQQTSKLPDNWPDKDYRGPGVTIKLCHNSSCRGVHLRGWPIGGVCVVNNMVGVCSQKGECISTQGIPRSNKYPTVVRLTSNETSAQLRTLSKLKVIRLFVTIAIFRFIG